MFPSFTDPSRDFHDIDDELDNRFTNPFYRAYSDAQWRAIVDHPDLDIVHMVTTNIAQLLANRSYNDARLEAFLPFLDTLPPEQRVPDERDQLFRGP